MQGEDQYLEIVEERLRGMGVAGVIQDDIDLICKYVVLRFLKTSMFGSPSTPASVAHEALNEFVTELMPIILSFIRLCNSRLETESRGDA